MAESLLSSAVETPLPTGSVLGWSELEVGAFFASLGLPYYEQQIQEHGLSGEILVHVDHEALKDIGISSVGQRIAILKSVYNLKLRDNLPIEEGHWVPPSDGIEDAAKDEFSNAWAANRSATVARLLAERDERVKGLEHQVTRLSAALEDYKDQVAAIARRVYSEPNILPPQLGLSRSASLARNGRLPAADAVVAIHPSMASLAHKHTHSASQNDNAGTHTEGADISMSLGMPDESGNGESPLVSPNFFHSGHEPIELLNPANTHHSSAHVHNPDGTSLTFASTVPHSAVTTSPSTPVPGTPNVSTTPVAATLQDKAITRSSFDSIEPNLPSKGADIDSLRPSIASTVTLVDETTSLMAETFKFGTQRPSLANPDKLVEPFSPTSLGQGKGLGSGSLSSFKVTLEDPCSKVLPAALRKYKINDDWRLYALFLCYGNNVERCLALDERPLLLFQRLKENDMNPVFMLRHIKDIRSPMSIAASKHASRKERRQREAEEKTLIGTNAAAPLLNAEFSPGKPTRQSEVGNLAIPSKTGAMTFGVAVYPYFAERSDELHVQLRDVFQIDAKAKGWWRVHRHSAELADPGHGWIPSGCLVEVTHLPPPGTRPEDSESIVHAPDSLLSQHVNGPALLDYKPRGDGELRLVKGETLAVYKRYSSWSYVVRTTAQSCEGGWSPSWLVGRAPRNASQNI